ncbi:hypothetical protein OHV05_33815 [Kitasatospora sp. NBC_00070]|uniref:hypothetical protein n=1 Tax=Kitasatospora sp. NBC_00070 TaxID=2975962 RepID=UPI0032515571
MINDEMPQLAARLAELAEEPAPEMRLDLELGRRLGRSRLRRRRLSGLAGTLAVLVTVGLLGAGLRDRHDGTPAPAVSPTVGPSSITMNVRFGWLPDWVHSGLGYTVEDGRGHASVQMDGATEPAFSLTLTPRGSEPESKYELQDAPKVNGRPAYWLMHESLTAVPDERGYLLRWQVRDGRWAELKTVYLPRTAASERDVLRVAAGMTVEAVQVPLPVHFADALGPVRARGASLIRSNSAGEIHWWMGLSADVDGQRMSVVATRSTHLQPDGTPSSDQIEPSNGECRMVGDVHLCLSSDQAAFRGLTPEEQELIRKVLDGIEVTPDFK